eukprot:7307485-Prymnesium_polylepis.1
MIQNAKKIDCIAFSSERPCVSVAGVAPSPRARSWIVNNNHQEHSGPAGRKHEAFAHQASSSFKVQAHSWSGSRADRLRQ